MNCNFLHKIVIFLILFHLSSRPVSYPQSWTFMQMNDGERNRLHIHWTSDYKNSFGFVFQNLNTEDLKAHIYSFQWNHLLYRKNTKTSQFNSYFKQEYGILDYKNNHLSEEKYIALTLSADYETRRFYTAYEYQYELLGSKDEVNNAFVGRVGLAPYLGRYNELHTWLILELDHNIDTSEETEAFILRFFKFDYLLEIGYTTNSDYIINFIIRF